jgi:branched-chain amino acid transport system ATP-binding protein
MILEPGRGSAGYTTVTGRFARPQGVSILLAEQSLTLGLSAADRAYVLDHGRIVLSGTAAEMASDQRVADAYLGR